MALILNINTATEIAGIYLSKDGELIASSYNEQQYDHATWIHQAIDKILKQNSYTVKDLVAVAVTAGPCSYTGLRVGMATAKGLCYALTIPLITESTLKLMAAEAISQHPDTAMIEPEYFCPLIDARRMEVFTALYDGQLKEIIQPRALILEEHSFEQYLSLGVINFFGSGSDKWEKMAGHSKFRFINLIASGKQFSILSYSKFIKQEFAILAYEEPVYLKEFYIHPK
ncbi:MAG: tRNA (adenosine(37)-N6)-threonylcarbamoyltransferase complex dimerization subunit type 1 TsaB [Chitinophagaceae bacterium]